MFKTIKDSSSIIIVFLLTILFFVLFWYYVNPRNELVSPQENKTMADNKSNGDYPDYVHFYPKKDGQKE